MFSSVWHSNTPKVVVLDSYSNTGSSFLSDGKELIRDITIYTLLHIAVCFGNSQWYLRCLQILVTVIPLFSIKFQLLFHQCVFKCLLIYKSKWFSLNSPGCSWCHELLDPCSRWEDTLLTIFCECQLNVEIHDINSHRGPAFQAISFRDACF